MTHLLPLILMGCVVKYGDPPDYGTPDPTEAAEPVDLSDLEKQLGEMLYSTQIVDVDRRDRLSAAEDLARTFRDADPAYQAQIRVYLQRVVDIEERSTPLEVPEVAGFEGLGDGQAVGEEILDDPVVEEEILDDPGALPDRGEEPAEDPDGEKPETAEAAAEIAREALAADDYKTAVDALAWYRYTDDWAPLEGLWAEAVDGWVHDERERAGALFLQARDLPQGAERLDRIEEVQRILEGLVRDYPDSSYREAIDRNLQLVKDELSRR